ncbi:MAG TPA: hypothetical protein VG963_16710 [Polyangiaceae bacterium]|nr:hypothetical protein [Polyangiaceae bacterium]
MALGCTPLRRTSECLRVVDTINSGISGIQNLSNSGRSAAVYRQIATAYEQLGKQLGALLPKDSDLSKALASYRDLTQRAAKHARDYSEELAKVPEGATLEPDTQARLDRIRSAAKVELTREASLVRKLNSLCHP